MKLFNQIKDRINRHYKITKDFKNGYIDAEQFESGLLSELNFLEQDLESVLNSEICEQEAILLKSFKNIKSIIENKKTEIVGIDNVIMSRICQLLIDEKYL